MDLTEIPYDPNGFVPILESDPNHVLVIAHGRVPVERHMVPEAGTIIVAPREDGLDVLYQGVVVDGTFVDRSMAGTRALPGGYVVRLTGRQAVTTPSA